jgi:hypothetical protein
MQVDQVSCRVIVYVYNIYLCISPYGDGEVPTIEPLLAASMLQIHFDLKHVR